MEFDLGTLLMGDMEEANFKLPDPDLLQFYKDLGKNHLWLDTEVSYEACSHLIKWLLAADREPYGTPIYIHIMSGGGELDVMFTIYDIIKNMRRPVVTINEGRCHSAAFIIFLAGETRLMRPHSIFVAHEGSAGMGGTYKEVQQATESYKKSVDAMREIISTETAITLEQLKDHFDKESDWYIDYEQAKEFGIIKEAVYEESCNGQPVREVKLALSGYAKID